jgi:hypothetical protein
LTAFSEVRVATALHVFYLSFTEGLRPFNTEARGRVYSVGGPGSTAVFLAQLPESAA